MIKRFIDDLCAINDDKFFKSFKNIPPKELELKLEHKETFFINLGFTTKDNIFIFKLFDKSDKFPFFSVRMTHLSSNISSSIFYGSLYSELLRIARCTLIFHRRHLNSTNEWSFKEATLSSYKITLKVCSENAQTFY